MRGNNDDGGRIARARERFRVSPDAGTEIMGEQASGAGVILFSVALFVAVLAACLGVAFYLQAAVTLGAIVVAVIVATLVTMGCQIAQQWERVVVLRFGKFHRVAGPGLFFTIPIIESKAMHIDTRLRVTTFGAEETLTSDLVPMNVNAVLFWHVWDAKAACNEVGDFAAAVEFSAQTALRDAIGRASAAEVAIRREQLDRELRRVLEEKVAPWGVTILSVEVRDILLPKELQDIMSLEAQAEQRKKARIILIEAEQDIFEMLNEMEGLYEENDPAVQLRTMHLLNESLREGKGTVVIPSAFAEGFSDIFPKGM